MPHFLLRSVVVATVVAWAFRALAVETSNTCPVADVVGSALDTARVDPRVRLTFIDQELAAGVGAARRWAYGWGGLQVGSVAGNTTLYFVGDPETKPDRVFSGATALVGLTTTILNWPALLRDQATVAALAANDHRDPTCSRLARAEELLVADARQEAKARGLLRHLLNFGFNGSMAIVLGAGFDRWRSAAIQGSTAFLVGEAIIFTRPTTAGDALARYRTGDFTRRTPEPTASLHLTPTGLALSGTF